MGEASESSKLTEVLLDQMKTSLDLSSMENPPVELKEVQEATDIITQHKKKWEALRHDIGHRKADLEQDVHVMENLLNVKREELLQLKIEYEKRRTTLERKQIEELKQLEDQQREHREKEDASMKETLGEMLKGMEKARGDHEIEKEIALKRESMEKQLQEELDRMKKERLAQMEAAIHDEEIRLKAETTPNIGTEDLLHIPTEAPEGLGTEAPRSIQTQKPPKAVAPPVEEDEEAELNCTWDEDEGIFTLSIDEITLEAGSYSVVNILKEVFEEYEVKEFHVDLESVEKLTSRVIELVLKLVSTFRGTTTVKLENALEHFLSTFQMLGLDKSIPIHTIPSSNPVVTEAKEGDWKV